MPPQGGAWRLWAARHSQGETRPLGSVPATTSGARASLRGGKLHAAFDYPGGGQYRIINNTAGSVGPRLALFRDQPPAFNWRASRSKLT